MTVFVRSVALLIFLLCLQSGYGQTPKEAAEFQLKQALIFEEQGKIDEAIALIEKAQGLDTANIEYPYELAYAYYLKKDHNKAIPLLEKLSSRKDAFGKIYQLLGNVYDDTGRQDTAITIYKAGLSSFPNTGELYLELGNIFLKKKVYETAAYYYEQGIIMDPAFPSNYYRLSKMFFSSTEKVWGMIYGEIFLLLERNTERTAEINKLLYDGYKKQITMGADSVFKVNFTTTVLPQVIIGGGGVAKKPPFEKAVYEPILLSSLKTERSIDINSLSRARKKFIEYYFISDTWQKYPNVLFDYQYRALKAGHMEAYSHWVLAEGDHDAFVKWQEANKEKYLKFFKWFLANPLNLDVKYKFYRGQY